MADKPPIPMTIASKVDPSMISPRPPRAACRAVVAATAAANVPASHSPSRPPACTGSSPGQPRPEIELHNACKMNSLASTLSST